MDSTFNIKPRILAVDYGTKRIGLAQSDPFWMFAQSVGTFDEAKFLSEVEKIFRLDGIEKFIVGYPLGDGGETNRMTRLVDEFIAKLTVRYPAVPVEKTDEHSSSKNAMHFLVEQGVGKKKRQQKGRLDRTVAAMLLQAYLESQPK
ncbi:MAG: Holliday junction resolvase RuvX [Rhizobacter sp.]|nr:Holliday junction resolvase RuvX [Chlorobiales bacterium]